MRKTARLDEILLNLGYVEQGQITAALRRQEEHGGRLGMNLVETGAIDEKQLLTALAEQFRLPMLLPKEEAVPAALVARMPADVLANGVAVPLSWNEVQEVLSIAVSNPGDVETIQRVKEAFGAKGVRVAVAPERILKAIGERLGSSNDAADEGAKGIALPELFAWEAPQEADELIIEEVGDAETRVLMVVESPATRNFLPPLFKREGIDLLVTSELEEVASALEALEFESVLVSEPMAEVFQGWVEQGAIAAPTSEVVVFRSISEALLGNPLPYDQMAASLRHAVHALADARSAALGLSPCYGLITSDLAALADELGLERVARDGLDLGAHLLLPGEKEPFHLFTSSLELAAHLRFPWPLDVLLAHCHRLFMGKASVETTGEVPPDVHTAAQMLALVWFRHHHVPDGSGTDEERMASLRSGVRAAAGRLAGPELAEAYLRVLADRSGAWAADQVGPVLLVGAERLERVLSPAMSRVGRETSVTADLGEAQLAVDRSALPAIVIDYHEFHHKVDQFTRVTKLSGNTLLFVIADSDDPSLVLNLLDAGVDDVFVPPHDFGLIAARVNRAIQSRSRVPDAEDASSGQFSATFEVFSFLDLIQMLGHAMKTVRIDLVGPDQSAVIYMEGGRLTHATCGESTGEAAVCRVIGWQEKGQFTVHEETDFPEATIQASTEAVLMEGCRLLDESTRGAAR